jgi:hypothetical protein
LFGLREISEREFEKREIEERWSISLVWIGEKLRDTKFMGPTVFLNLSIHAKKVRRMATFYYISIIALVSFFHFHLCTISIFSISTISFSFL